MDISVALPSKAYICDRSIVGTAGSSPAEGTYGHVLCL